MEPTAQIRADFNPDDEAITRLHRLAFGVDSAGAEPRGAWLHVDFEPHLEKFDREACGFEMTSAGLLRSAERRTPHPIIGEAH